MKSPDNCKLKKSVQKCTRCNRKGHVLNNCYETKDIFGDIIYDLKKFPGLDSSSDESESSC